MNALIINCSPVRTGATAEITSKISTCLASKYDVRIICIDDYQFEFCKGCRSCHNTAKCIMQDDDITKIIDEFEWADKIVSISPSYWADIPGQFKAFIDRCTPWCNTHEPHAAITKGKKGYSIALRTGPSMRECNRINESIEHFYGHLEITPSGSLGLCSIEYKTDVPNRAHEIEAFCNLIKSE
ncbi:flavodoxin family protein [Lachnospiraceae bacterium MD1]|uniref:Flavodoxin family protein n=1 Tax=Variimorphobacter saccharofermentans TaxID=2755051 RepID=A0A839JXQ5_9FIRM|nr:flavodoxin family protein [Variimorphobacter saccharofermentans]MBB2182210.1 flavodoxin family protein [Variimorphobacter saccharofermentans]